MHDSFSLLSHLLPYDNRLKVKKSLPASIREYRTLLQALHSAICNLQCGRLDKFDPLVGENGCHIRAVWLAIHAMRCRVASFSLLGRVEKALVKINNLLSVASIRQLMQSNVSLNTLIKQEELDIVLTNEEMFIFQSYVLSEVKVDHGQSFSLDALQATNPKKLKIFGDISGTFADHLTSKLRLLLSENSVRYIRSIAASSQDSWLMHMVSEKFTITHNSLSCTPHFWTCKALLHAAIQASLPLVIHAKFVQNSQVIDDACLLFTTTQNGTYSHVGSLETPGHLAWIIQGIVNTDMSKEQWKTDLCSRSISELFLAGAADHKPYPNHMLEAFSDTESEWYRTLALKEGYSSKNRSTFFIRHVYSSFIDQFGKSIKEAR